jgi:hypothetical protein
MPAAKFLLETENRGPYFTASIMSRNRVPCFFL